MPDPVLFTSFFSRYSATDILTAMLKVAGPQKYGLACWRLPQQEEFRVSISENSNEIKAPFAVENAPAGFVMHPFESSETNRAYFFETSLLLKGNFRENKLNLESSRANEFSDTFFKEIATILEKENPVKPGWLATNLKPETKGNFAFENLVEKAVKFMDQGGAEKIVLSRASVKELPIYFSPVQAFQNLCQLYPQAFISLVSTAETGTWLGASPEILVRKDSQNTFRTVALAGTQKLAAGQKPADAIWRQKEIEEQSNVVRYIISCFKQIRLREYLETGPRTIVAGNLLHLRTDFCVNLNEQADFPHLTSQMLQLLHPTSAVCGQPKEAALNFIKAHEKYDRRFYSGYLGPVNIAGETALFVNLRCLELLETAAVLYAGAGITPDSDPGKEWTETELKMQTVLAALQPITVPDDTATGY